MAVYSNQRFTVMITVLFKLNNFESASTVVVAGEDDLLRLASAFETSKMIMHYAIVDNTYSVFSVPSVAHYGWNPEAFTKFTKLEDF